MTEQHWWQSGVIYQVYPRSFQDTDGDGVGDLEGIRRRLGHLVELGVDAVWISPIYPSPMADFGYDVADYCDIDPAFGTLADFDRLIADTHALGLKLILDFVPNHTSEAHPWFAESRGGRASPKRDWYVWRDPAPDGGPPNNWVSNFGGSAWEFEPASGQYYYHAFLKEQPDLNWRNPEVRAAMYDVLRFWLDRGVDGFRVDVIWHLIKDAGFRDNLPNPNYRDGMPEIERFLQTRSADQPETIEIVQEMRSVLDGYGDRVLIGEIYLPLERLMAYYGPDLSGAQLPFNFRLILELWSARGIAGLIDDYEALLPPGGWPNWVLGNHDQKRIATRVGEAQSRVAAMLLLTLRGTPTLYYGDEIGLPDGVIPPEAVRDPWAINEPGVGGRDPCRIPTPWDASPNGGFSEAAPWLPMAAPELRNVAEEIRDPGSMLALHRKLLALRRAHHALNVGDYEGVAAAGDLLVYRRRYGAETLLVALNLGHAPARFDGVAGPRRVLLSTHLDRDGDEPAGLLELRADEGVVVVEL